MTVEIKPCSYELVLNCQGFCETNNFWRFVMTKFEYLLNKANNCLLLAGIKDKNLKKFYLNAHRGFLEKLNKLTIKEAFEIV